MGSWGDDDTGLVSYTDAGKRDANQQVTKSQIIER